MPAIIGAHLRNETRLQPQDRARYIEGRFEGAVVFAYQDPAEVRAMGVWPRHSVVRLSDSVQGGRILGDEELANLWEREILKWLSFGFLRFQLDNEPNLSWRGQTPPPGKTLAWFWAWLLRRVLKRLWPKIEALPVILLLTPMSHPSLIDPARGINNPIWLDEALASEPGFPSVASYCEEAAAHCYWQRAEDMTHSGLGAEYEYVHQKTGLRIRVTECGNSSIHNSPPPPMPEIVAEQAHDYPLYCRQARAVPYMLGIYFYILGYGPPPADWPGFDLVPPVTVAIGSR